MKKTAKQSTADEDKITELTADLKRLRADFENYRKRVDSEKRQSVELGETKAIMKLLPVIDTIERAISHIPEDIADHRWVQGVANLVKQLDKQLDELGITRIDANQGVVFDPAVHQAVQFDDGEGDQEVISEQMQSGYQLRGKPIRHAMVRVARK